KRLLRRVLCTNQKSGATKGSLPFEIRLLRVTAALQEFRFLALLSFEKPTKGAPMKKLLSTLLFTLLLLLSHAAVCLTAAEESTQPSGTGLSVHEWGTFTSFVGS